MTRFQSPPSPRQRQYHELPRFWRAKLKPADQLRAGIIHWDLVTRFVDGSATPQILWDWIETGLTYCQMMQLLAIDGLEFQSPAIAAMNAQIESYDSVIARYRTTQRVGFNAAELATARAAAEVMDGLLALDRNGIADQAGRWAVEQMQALRATGRLPRKGKKP